MTNFNNDENYEDLRSSLDERKIDYVSKTLDVDMLKIMDFCKQGGIFIVTESAISTYFSLISRKLNFNPQSRGWVYRKNSSSPIIQFVNENLE